MLAADLSAPCAVADVRAQAGSIDILVNNAGAIPPGDLLQIEDGAWRQAWDLKVFGYINLVRQFYPMLKERKGVVVNVIGTSGERAEPNYIAGSSGNAALIAFTRGLGSNSPRDGVRVVGVNPGAVSTERIETLLLAGAQRLFNDASRWQERYSTMPFGRAATPEEIANAVVFLLLPGRPTRAEPYSPSMIQRGLLCSKDEAPDESPETRLWEVGWPSALSKINRAGSSR